MNFLEFLKKSENARKIFGKRELKIIEKQLLGVNLTQSEKNRLSRDIRKKLKFIKGASKFEEEFELKKAYNIKELIQGAKKEILEDVLFKKIKKIFLYGSTIEKKLALNSDIDLAVKFDEITLREATLFRKRILGKVKNKIDIQVYNFLPNKIREEINKKGRILYED